MHLFVWRHGAYHFFHFDVDWGQQAHLFFTTVGSLKDGELPPVLDLEQQSYRDGLTGVSPDDGARRALAWLDTIKDKLGLTPIVYTDRDFARNFLTNPKFGDYPLWLAAYGVPRPPAPMPWTKLTFWQHDEHGICPGVSGDCDLDQFIGNSADLSGLCKQL